MYRAFGLLKPDSDFNLAQAADRLKTQLPGFAITTSPNQLTLRRGDWEIAMALVTNPNIPTETQGITDKIAGFEPAEAELLMQSDRRVEVWSDSVDPMMEHFNDFLLMVEVLKTFRGVVAVDPGGPGLM